MILFWVIWGNMSNAPTKKEFYLINFIDEMRLLVLKKKSVYIPRRTPDDNL